MVRRAAAVPRLKVPAYNWWHKALHGVLAKHAIVFPEPIALGATFDTPLVHQMAVVISYEVRAKHEQDMAAGRFDGIGLDFWAPNINIFVTLDGAAARKPMVRTHTSQPGWARPL